MLLYGQNVKKEYGDRDILDVSKIEIYEGDRIGLIGRNGAGKTTLLKILMGEISCDTGSIKRDCDIAYISQEGVVSEEADEKYISQMGLRGSAVKSGGEVTRHAIAAAFSRQAGILFADEPTTNLDQEGIEKLKNMMMYFPGALVLVSHDRELLDEVCTQIWEIEEGNIRIFPGNYSDWSLQKQRERDHMQFEYNQYQGEKQRLEQEIRNVKEEGKRIGKPPRKMSSSEWMLYKGIASVQQGHVQNRAKAMEKRVEHLEVKERPIEMPKVSMKMKETSKIRAKNAGRISKLTVCYEERVVLKEAVFDIPAGEKNFLMGENGCGKTTLLQALLNREDNTFITSEAKVGYFSQNHDILDYEKTVLENVKAEAAVPEHICRAVLNNLYLSTEDMTKKVKVLSGGERVKTALAMLLVSGYNFLILDEPTNHMDIYTMEGLERLLQDYDGTLLVVSHDRKFMKNIADRVFLLEDGNVQEIFPEGLKSAEKLG